MKVRFKKLAEEATKPRYSRPGDGALDLFCTSVNFTEKFVEYGTGIALEIPEGYVGLLFPRSSVSEKDLVLANSVGFVDHNYRGEIKLRFKKVYNSGDTESHTDICPDCGDFDSPIEVDCPTCGGLGEVEFFDMYEVGDRIAQLFIVERLVIELEEAEELSSTNRGEQGFGSSGK